MATILVVVTLLSWNRNKIILIGRRLVGRHHRQVSEPAYVGREQQQKQLAGHGNPRPPECPNLVKNRTHSRNWKLQGESCHLQPQDK